MFKRGQVLLEYLLLLGLVAVLALASFRPNGVIDQTLNSSKAYYKDGARAILGGYYGDDGKVAIENPSPIHGGWCAWSSCINGTKVRECACPRPAFGGLECADDRSQDGTTNETNVIGATASCGPTQNMCPSGLHYVIGQGCGCYDYERWNGTKCVPCTAGTTSSTDECNGGSGCSSCKCQSPYVKDGAGACTLCGNGTLDNGEACDGGIGCTKCVCQSPYISNDSLSCTLCGNGQIDSGEQCDGGSYCTNCACPTGYVSDGALGCTLCGNHALDSGEQCDGGTGCTKCVCQSPYISKNSLDCTKCGNGQLDSGEQCDGGANCTQCACPANYVGDGSRGCTHCGNGACDLGETAATCPGDCCRVLTNPTVQGRWVETGGGGYGTDYANLPNAICQANGYATGSNIAIDAVTVNACAQACCPEIWYKYGGWQANTVCDNATWGIVRSVRCCH